MIVTIMRGDADAERQRDHRRRGEPPLLRQQAHREPHVLHSAFHPPHAGLPVTVANRNSSAARTLTPLASDRESGVPRCNSFSRVHKLAASSTVGQISPRQPCRTRSRYFSRPRRNWRRTAGISKFSSAARTRTGSRKACSSISSSGRTFSTRCRRRGCRTNTTRPFVSAMCSSCCSSARSASTRRRNSKPHSDSSRPRTSRSSSPTSGMAELRGACRR